MCGIVGFITSKSVTPVYTKNMMDWLGDALVVDVLRGADGTGVAAIPKKDLSKSYVIKTGNAGAEFVNSPTGKKFLVERDLCCVIGHNRKATKGLVCAENAHPFKYGNITMVHNGTLDYISKLEKISDVDSEWIAYDLHKRASYIDTLENISGAYALVWHDASQSKIYMARNEERPLGFRYTEDKRGVFFASETWMIDILAERNKIKLDDTVWSLEPGYLISFDPNNEVLEYAQEGEFKYETITYYNNRYYSGKHSSYNKNKSNATNLPKEREKRSQALLDKYNLDLEIGGPIDFIPTEFERYPGSRSGLGKVLGVAYGFDQSKSGSLLINTMTHGFNMKEYNSLLEDDGCLGIIEYVREVTPHGAPPYLEITVSNVIGVSGVSDEFDDDDEESPGGGNLIEMIKAWDNNLIPADEWFTRTSNGCSFCSASLVPSRAEDYVWGDSSIYEVYCEECSQIIRSSGKDALISLLDNDMCD